MSDLTGIDISELKIGDFRVGIERNYERERIKGIRRIRSNAVNRVAQSANKALTVWCRGGLQYPKRPADVTKEWWIFFVVDILRQELPKKYTGRATWPIFEGDAGPVKLG